MNMLVYSALALTLVSVPGYASENEWSSLDQEIESLSSSLSAQNTVGPKINGWVIASFRASGDEELGFEGDGNPANGNEDRQGFFLESARVEISGDAGSDYSYKLSFDLSSSDLSSPRTADDPTTPTIDESSSPNDNSGLTIRDAYANFKIGDAVNGRMGRFKQPFLRSGLISDNRLLFLDRTALGEIFARRELGLMFFGNFDTIDWYIAGQNGDDGAADEYLFTGRVVANLIGSGVGKVEGAYGAGDETNLSIGGSVADEGTLDDGLHFAIEAAMAQGPFSVAAEVVDFDDGDPDDPATPLVDEQAFGIGLPIFGAGDVTNSTPWDVTASYMFTDMYELAVRYEDADDSADSRRYGAVVNRYVQGHDIKWLLQYQRTETEDATGGDVEIDEFGLGLAVSF